MYLQNKYTHWYYSIIDHARGRPPVDQPIEKHHIIPRSLGGSDDKINLVRLTLKEHRLCHLLLTRMLTGMDRRRMLFAAKRMFDKCAKFHGMSRGESYVLLRQQVRIAVSEMHRGRIAHNRGSKHTDEVRARCGKINRGKIWYTDGVNEISTHSEPPTGWWPGRKKSSIPHNPNPAGCVGNARGKRRYTNGIDEILIDGPCPDGYWPGRKKSFAEKALKTKRENGTLNSNSPRANQKRIQTKLDRYGTLDPIKIKQIRLGQAY